MYVSTQDIVERWNSRIVGKYDQVDGSGVVPYLLKYGKRISDEKLEKYAEYAASLGYREIANEFYYNTSYGLFKRFGEKLPNILKQDFDKMVYYDPDNKRDDFDLFHGKEYVIYTMPSWLTFEFIRAVEFKKIKEVALNFQFAIVSYGEDYPCLLICDKNFTVTFPNYQIFYKDGTIFNKSLHEKIGNKKNEN